MIRAVIYARFSSENQREESIEGQIRECRKYAQDHGMSVVAEYADRALSGRTDKRPDFLRMIKDAERGRFDVIIMWKLDRFARNRYDSATYKAKLKKAGVILHYVKEYIPDDPTGIILESVLEGMAEYYSANLAQNISRGLMENALKGKFIGGRVPLGYQKDSEGKLALDPVTAPVVERIFNQYADGVPIIQICVQLNEQGVKTSIGGQWNKNSVRKMLKNRKYIGEYAYKDVFIADGVPRIVSNELFERVQKRVNANTRIKGGTYKASEQYLLATKVFCGHCGAPMIGESGTSKTGRVYHYYKCVGRKRGTRSCPKVIEKKHWLEEIVIRETLTHVLTRENIDLIADKAIELLEEDAKNNSVLESLESQLKEVNSALRNLLRALEAGIFNSTTQSRMTELEALKEQLEIKAERERQSKPILEKEEIVFWLESFREGDINDEEYRRRVIDTLLSKVLVFDETDDDRDRKLVLTFNLTQNNGLSISGSELTSLTPPFHFKSEPELGSDLLYLSADAQCITEPIYIFVNGVFGCMFPRRGTE